MPVFFLNIVMRYQDAHWNVDFLFRFGSKNAWFIYGIMALF